MACGAVGHRRHDEPVADEIPELNLQRLTDELEAAVELAAALPDDTLTHLAAAIRDEIRRRAREGGNHDAIIEEAFQQAFGRDSLGAAPWVEGDVIVCPGATIAKSRTSHRSRFISVDETWVWDSIDLIVEEKKSHPGKDEGFKAVALVPVIEGMALDLVTIKGRNGVLNAERVVSYEVQRGELIEVSARTIELRGLP